MHPVKWWKTFFRITKKPENAYKTIWMPYEWGPVEGENRRKSRPKWLPTYPKTEEEYWRARVTRDVSMLLATPWLSVVALVIAIVGFFL